MPEPDHLAFVNVAEPDGTVAWRAQSDPREEVLVRYTRGTGRFSADKRFITLSMEMFDLDDRPDGHHQGVWEAAFTEPAELLRRPPAPVGGWNEPTGPVAAVPVQAHTKGVWVFADGSSVTAVGPALSHLVPLADGSFLFLVSCAQTITGGTGRYAGARGLKTSLGSTHVHSDLFAPGDVRFEARTLDTFRVLGRDHIAAPGSPAPGSPAPGSPAPGSPAPGSP